VVDEDVDVVVVGGMVVVVVLDVLVVVVTSHTIDTYIGVVHVPVGSILMIVTLSATVA